jgi:hypothetical protein
MLLIIIVSIGMGIIFWKFDNVEKMASRRTEKENRKKGM